MRIYRIPLAILWMCLIGSLTSAQNTEDAESELRVSDVEWGFDGALRSKTFVPLRFQVKNRGSEGRDLQVRLVRTDGGSDVSEEYRQAIHVSAGISRTVQIVPFINDSSDRWSLIWGEREDEMIELNAPGADDGVALLVSRNDPSARSGELARLIEEGFPTTITALDALRVLAIDHEPDWSRPQKKALEEWVRLGGRVVLLKPPGGTVITFSPGLEFLNAIEEGDTLGAGKITRLDLEASEVKKSTIERRFLGRRLSMGDTQYKLEMFDRSAGRQSYDRSGVLSTLKELSSFGQRWWLIYLIVLVYVGYQYHNGAKQGLLLKHTRVFFTRMGIATAVASIVICFLSRVGSSSQDRIRTAAVARRIAPGVYDVEGWAAASTALNGGDHRFAVAGEAQLYGAGESYGQNPLKVIDGSCVVDQSAFATQKLAYRTRIAMPDLPIEWGSGGLEAALAARIQNPGPGPKIHDAAVIVGNNLTRIKKSKTAEQLAYLPRSATLTEWIRERSSERLNGMRMRTMTFGRWLVSDTDDELYEGVFEDLVGNAFRVGVNVYPDSFIVPPGMARVLVLADWPKELAITGDYPDVDGRIVYVWDVPIRLSE